METGSEEENTEKEIDGIYKDQDRKVLEWTESDADAEEWEWLSNNRDFSAEIRKGDAEGLNWIWLSNYRNLSAEVRRGLEWTEYDSEAQREEAKNENFVRLRLPLDVQ